MTLRIIGSGFGRTGTMTMKEVLGTLGFGPVHHMVEVMQNPVQLEHWKAVFAGGPVNWEAVFDGYTAQVDWPGASVWEQTMHAFPNAKVIHTERPAEEWWASFNGTIGKLFAVCDTLTLPPHIVDVIATMKTGFLSGTFADFTERDSSIEAFRRNNARVREIVPADRLLVFNPAEGWAPLCAFLGVPVPDTPFPHHHVRNEFWAHFGGEPA